LAPFVLGIPLCVQQPWYDVACPVGPSTAADTCYFALSRGVNYCDEYVCLFVCLYVCSRNSKTHGRNFTKFFVHVVCGRGMVLLLCCWDMLCTSGFVDDVPFLHNGPVACHVLIEHNKHNSRDFKQILLNDKDQKYSLSVMDQSEVCCL